VNEIKSYFKLEEQEGMILSPLKGVHIKSNILEIIWKRFKIEGVQISAYDFKLLVMRIFSVMNIENKEKFCWLLSAYPQDNWLTLLSVIELEAKYEIELRSEWRKSLHRIRNKNLFSIFVKKVSEESPTSELIKSLFSLLPITNQIDVNLEDFDELRLTAWTTKLIELKIEIKLNYLNINWTKDSKIRETILYYLFELYKRYENTLIQFLKVLSFVSNIDSDLLMRKINSLYTESSILIDVPSVMKRNIHCEEIFEICCENLSGERNVRQIISIIEKDRTVLDRNLLQDVENLIKSANIYGKTTVVRSMETRNRLFDMKITHWNQIKIDKKELEEFMCLWITEFKKLDKYMKKEFIPEVLAIIDQIIKYKRNFFLRDTQKVSILSAILSETNLLSQVSTGEGKSLIVVAIAIIKTLLVQTVDVITSSSVLAERDAKQNNDIFEIFRISVGHNTYNSIEKRREEYKKEVIYGDCSSFQ
jgi:imidazole glycerol phosphate synthase subunit HisF